MNITRLQIKLLWKYACCITSTHVYIPIHGSISEDLCMNSAVGLVCCIYSSDSSLDRFRYTWRTYTSLQHQS